MLMELHRLLNDLLTGNGFIPFVAAICERCANGSAPVYQTGIERVRFPPLTFATVAQLAEQPPRKRQGMSSNLIGGFFLRDRPTGRTADSESANRGSNPRLSVFRNVAQRQEPWSYKPVVVGSSPTVPISGNARAPAGKSFCQRGRGRSQTLGVVAKLERRQSCKLVIVGSSPTDSINCF